MECGPIFAICPFNSQHKMLKENLQRHIIRCKENYPDYVACKYNSLHWFETNAQMKEHLENCPSRKVNFKETGNPVYHQPLPSTMVNESRKFHLSEENWDADYI